MLIPHNFALDKKLKNIKNIHFYILEGKYECIIYNIQTANE